MEPSVIENEVLESDVCEVHITSGLCPEDVDSLLEMAGTSGLFNSEEMIAAEDLAWGCAYQGSDASCHFLQARINTPKTEEPIGFLCFAEIPHWPHNYELFGIAVTPDYQRLGIGSALMAEMERMVTTRSGKRIFLETGDSRLFETPRLFYEANNYTMEQRFFKQFIPKDDAIVYCRTIESEKGLNCQ
ncbi:MAG: GNAT family N-acetyltransferase [Pseudodesulfovibrio sp.]|nr:GNAT family N-acetyltransferase [Pseudodesulfovibrio sp.]